MTITTKYLHILGSFLISYFYPHNLKISDNEVALIPPQFNTYLGIINFTQRQGLVSLLKAHSEHLVGFINISK
jgi:hypothetical protein